MRLRAIEGGGQSRRDELLALIDDGVDPIVEAMRVAVERGEYEQLVQHAEDLREAAQAIRDGASAAG